MKSTISKLEDEILSFKLHACNSIAAEAQIFESGKDKCVMNNQIRINSSSQEQKNINDDHQKNTNDDHQTSQTPNSSSQTPKSLLKTGVDQNKQKPDTGKSKPSDTNSKSSEPPKNIDRRNRKKQVLLVGTSNITYLSAKYIAGQNAYVRKVIKYTVKEATEYEGDEPDLVIFQSTCNDIKKKNNDEIINELNELVRVTKKKFTDKNIIISLPLPRKERALRIKIRTLSAAISKNFSEGEKVICSNNSNLTCRGEPHHGVLDDNKHLSK